MTEVQGPLIDPVELEVQRLTRAEEIAVINAALKWWALDRMSREHENRLTRKLAGWRRIGALLRLTSETATLASAREKASQELRQHGLGER